MQGLFSSMVAGIFQAFLSIHDHEPPVDIEMMKATPTASLLTSQMPEGPLTIGFRGQFFNLGKIETRTVVRMAVL